jgi:hypothetical protein
VKSEVQPINEEKLNAFIGKVIGDFGAALSSALVCISTCSKDKAPVILACHRFIESDATFEPPGLPLHRVTAG